MATQESAATSSPLRVAVVGGGPAGCLFALYALSYAALLGREVAVTIYEGKDFRCFGQPGCNMCAGLVPVPVLRDLEALGVAIPPALVLSQVDAYALHTSTGTIHATQPDPNARIISVHRGAGPRYGHPPDQVSFDELLLDEAVARGARLRRRLVDAVRRGPPLELVSAGLSARYDLVILATGVNGRLPVLQGFDYRPPPTDSMCQTEVYLGREAVERQLGSAVHIFLPPDELADYGILIPKGPFVAVSLLRARRQMRSLHAFMALPEVVAILGSGSRPVCGCLPRISVGPAAAIADDGFVAIGDAGVTRLFKNGIGSALRTARQAAWIAVSRGCSQADFVAGYLPLSRAIDLDNQIWRLLFLQVPLLKRFDAVSTAHYRLASAGPAQSRARDVHAQILWGMFTGAYSYGAMARMALTPALLVQLALQLSRSSLACRRARRRPDGARLACSSARRRATAADGPGRSAPLTLR